MISGLRNVSWQVIRIFYIIVLSWSTIKIVLLAGVTAATSVAVEDVHVVHRMLAISSLEPKKFPDTDSNQSFARGKDSGQA